MIKTLTKHGNSYALIIDKPILDLLRITPETPLEITTDGNGFYVAPPKEDDEPEEVREEFKEALDRINKRFAGVLKRLA